MEMKSIDEIRRILRAHLPELKERYYVEEIALFGSYARGEQTDESDLDLLVTLSAPLGWEFVDLHDYLAALLETDVDVLTRAAIDRKPLLRHYIEQDLIRA
jgi:predicted nucleotidyltransferase